MFLLTSFCRWFRDNGFVLIKHGVKVMWQWVDSHILRETQSGFIVCLLSGSWSALEEIKPIAPQTMEFKCQAELLRAALEFAELAELSAPSSTLNAVDTSDSNQELPFGDFIVDMVEVSDYSYSI